MIGYVFLAGEIADYEFIKKYNLTDGIVICADSGYKHALNLGITPNYIVGDMDSIDCEVAENKNIKILSCDPVDKILTDGQMAVRLANGCDCDDIIIFGALNKGNSSRFDHVLGNVYLLKDAKILGVSAKIVERDCEIILIDKYTKFERRNFKYLSFLPLSETVKCLTLTGVKYPLNKVKITQKCYYTMSNEFAEDVATINLKKGELLAIMTIGGERV